MKSVFLILILITSLLSKGQTVISGKVVDDFERPISFTSIKSENGNNYFTDSLGNFKLNVTDKNEIFIFSCVGFESLRVSLNKDSLSILINLKKINYKLNEVIVKREKKLELTILGNKKFSLGRFLTKISYQYALFIPNTHNYTGIVNSVSFYLKKPPGGDATGNFRVRLYGVNPLDNKPGMDLLKTNLIVNGKNANSWLKVDLRHFNLELPKDGFFIAMELLPVKSYNEDKLIYVKGLDYENKYNIPAIGYNHNLKDDYTSYILFNKVNKWGVWDKIPNLNFLISSEVEIERNN
jgi:hypothetical protein